MKKTIILTGILISQTLVFANPLSYTTNEKPKPPKVNLSGFSSTIEKNTISRKNKKKKLMKNISFNKDSYKENFNKIKECELAAKTKEEKKACWVSKDTKRFSKKYNFNASSINVNDFEKTVNKASKNYGNSLSVKSFQKKQANIISEKRLENVYKNEGYKLSDKQFNQIKNFKLK